MYLNSMEKSIVVFVTGSTGFIGSHLTRRLVNDGFEVHILTRRSSNVFRIKDVIARVHRHYGDVTQKAKLALLIKKIRPSLIFHLANIGIYGGVEGNANDVISVNFTGTLNLLEAARSTPYKCFVNTGSSSEYGVKKNPMKENDSCQPESVYAISKLSATLVSQLEAQQYHKPVVNLRIFTPYGPYDSEKRLVTYAIGQAIKGKPLYLNNKSAVRDYVFIDDVVNAYLQCIKKSDALRGEVFNIGSGAQTSVIEIIGLIKRMTKTKSKILWGGSKEKRFESTVWKADTKKVKKLLEWKPRYSLQKGIEKTIAWHRENPLKITL